MTEQRTTKIPLEQLEFDSRNPRMPLRLQGVTDENAILDYMLKHGNILELMGSIAEAGYYEAEPLLVIGIPLGKFCVVEGNRRLSALKLLNRPTLAKVRVKSVHDIVAEANHRPDEIPCIVYEKRKDILDYLGYRHITGVKEWGSLEKARYLDQLFRQYDSGSPVETYRKIAKMIGSRRDYVLKLHTALALYNKANEHAYYGMELQEEDINFSWITTAIGYHEITDFLGIRNAQDATLSTLCEKDYERLFVWMFHPQKSVVSEVRAISKLAKAVTSKDALHALESGSDLDNALLYTSVPQDFFVERLQAARQDLKQAFDAFYQLNSVPEESRSLLEEISKLASVLTSSVHHLALESEQTDIVDKFMDSVKKDARVKQALLKYLSEASP